MAHARCAGVVRRFDGIFKNLREDELDCFKQLAQVLQKIEGVPLNLNGAVGLGGRARSKTWPRVRVHNPRVVLHQRLLFNCAKIWRESLVLVDGVRYFLKSIEEVELEGPQSLLRRAAVYGGPSRKEGANGFGVELHVDVGAGSSEVRFSGRRLILKQISTTVEQKVLAHKYRVMLC